MGMTPINQLMRAIMDDQKDKYEKMMVTLGIVLKGDEKSLTGKPLMKRTMQIWINAAGTLLSMIVTKLPSPRVAQKYRVENLYEGPMDDEAAKAMRACEKDGPLLMMGRTVEQISDVPCGNTVALVGVDQYLLKSGTWATIESAHNVADMKYSVSPVVKVAVKVKDGKELPKLVDGLKKLSKSDPLVICTTEENGEHIIAGCGELHIGSCLKDLREEYAQCEFTVSDPVVSYRETVNEVSSMTVLAKSPNKHNRIYLQAEPMSDELATLIESGKAGPKADPKERTKILKDTFDWDANAAQRIWAWGPDTEGANVVVDVTQGVQYLLEIKEHVNSAFQWASKDGPLCEENMRGIRYNLMDVTKPTLQEPVFLVEITCPQDAMSGVYNCMNLRRGCVFEENPREGTPLVQVKAY